MTEILSNLLGETVEVLSTEFSGGATSVYVGARGVVRAMYQTDRSGVVIVIENTYGDPFGALRGYDMHSNAVRVVRNCEVCGLWDHPSRMARPTPDPDYYAHASCYKRATAKEE